MSESDGSGRQEQVLVILGAEEERKLLEHYEEKSYLYGRRAQDLKAHTAALLRKYMKETEENMMQAPFSGKWPESMHSAIQLAPLHATQRREDGQDSGGGE